MCASADSTTYLSPDSLEEARDLLSEYPSAKITAGGQSLILLMRQGLLDPDRIVDISGVPDLSGVTERDDRVVVGATTTYDALESHDVSARYPELGDACEVIADPQVRNMGTIGGAVGHADPSLDIVPPLLCLDAEVRLGRAGETRTLPLEEFHLGHMDPDLDDGELVEAVSFDAGTANAGGAYEKHANVHGGWATVGAAAHVTLDDAGARFRDVRVAFAGVADTAVRAPTVEAALTGGPVAGDAIEAATDDAPADIDPLGDYLGSASYREHLATVLARRALETAVGRAGGAL